MDTRESELRNGNLVYIHARDIVNAILLLTQVSFLSYKYRFFLRYKAESYPQTTGKWRCLKTLRFRDVCARYITLLLLVRSYLRKIVFDQTWSLLCGDQALLFAQSSLNVIPVARYRACKTLPEQGIVVISAVMIFLS